MMKIWESKSAQTCCTHAMDCSFGMQKQPYTIGVFLKNPFTLRVKTRLAREIGQENANTLYLSLLKILFQTLGIFPRERIMLSVAGGFEHLQLPFPHEHQANGNLGDRMATFFGSHLRWSQKVILIGSDCPYTVADSMYQALSALEDSDVVIQPAIDGGYTLIGMNQFHKGLFTNMPWSTDQLLKASLAALSYLNLKCTLLESQRDIDTLEDLKIWLEGGGSDILQTYIPGWEFGL